MDPDLEELLVDARRRWREMVDDLAAGRRVPHPHALLEVAAVLEIQQPGEALERAAAAAREGAAPVF
jgi:hypothetical protein